MGIELTVATGQYIECTKPLVAQEAHTLYSKHLVARLRAGDRISDPASLPVLQSAVGYRDEPSTRFHQSIVCINARPDDSWLATSF